jgi:GDP-L-fucose synthase
MQEIKNKDLDFQYLLDNNIYKKNTMDKDSRIYIAGHTGLVGSALLKRLSTEGYSNLLVKTHEALDLTRQAQVEVFFEKQRPEYVFVAAAKVGGIHANKTYPAEFIYKNLSIQNNVIHSAWKTQVKRLLFLGSSCIYPRECPQSIKEEHLLSGPLESTNEPYAVAKIAGVKMSQSYNRQYGTNFISLMPTNLYGPNDNYDLETSHVLPALIRKFHLAKLASQGDWEAISKDEYRYGQIPDDILKFLASISKSRGYDPSILDSRPVESGQVPPKVVIWGSGEPRREFLHVDDLADCCIFLMNLEEGIFHSLIANNRLPLVNVGWGKDISIKELAFLIKEIVGFDGEIIFDDTKPNGTPRKLLDISKLTSLNWSPQIFLKQGIKRTHQWYEQKLNKGQTGTKLAASCVVKPS